MPRKREEAPDMLTIPQAATYTGTTKQNIWNLVKRGKIKAIRFGHVSLIPRSALDEYERTKSKGGRPSKNIS